MTARTCAGCCRTPEDDLLDALARLHAAGESGLRRGTALRRVVPRARPGGAGLGPARRHRGRTTSRSRPPRFAERLARGDGGRPTPLTPRERRARPGCPQPPAHPALRDTLWGEPSSRLGVPAWLPGSGRDRSSHRNRHRAWVRRRCCDHDLLAAPTTALIASAPEPRDPPRTSAGCETVKACAALVWRSTSGRRKMVGMEHRRLGRLGHDSSVVIYGAAALADVDQDDRGPLGPGGAGRGDQPLRRRGELRRRRAAARALDARIRGEIFLATKTGERDADARVAQINALARAAADRPRRPAAAARHRRPRRSSTGPPAPAARSRPPCAPMTRGWSGRSASPGTGHQAAATHLEALRRYPFATVLTPLNAVRGAT